MVLTAGREVPGAEFVRQRSEGVAIVLSGPAVNAWSEGGSKWKAWSSRLFTATLKVGGWRSGCLHVLSCYAPTFAASREKKDAFLAKLQDALSAVPSDDNFAVLGDFNACVGSRGVDDERWYQRGPHGYDELNDAGRELLSFLSTNEATVCNTWFQKRDISKQTWQHPKSQKWHCIDYLIMRKTHRRKCLDVPVMHGADYNTDHRMLRAKLVVGRMRACRRNSSTSNLSSLSGCLQYIATQSFHQIYTMFVFHSLLPLPFAGKNSPRGAFGDTDKLRRGKGIEVYVQACTKVGGSGGIPPENF